MRLFFLSYAVGAVLGAIALWLLNSWAAAVAFVFGSIIMMLNVAGLHFAWSRILVKKQVALPLGVIVIKYAILGLILYRVATENLLQVPWFAAGFGFVMISAVISTLYSSKKMESK